MTPYDPAAETAAILGWLGPLADDDADVVEERVEAVRAAWHAVDAAQAWDADDTEGRQAASAAAGQWALGDLTIREAADAVLRARVALTEAEDALRGACLAALDAGEGIVAVANAAGVSTTAVYRWRDGRRDLKGRQ